MKNKLLVGFWRLILPVPAETLHRHVAEGEQAEAAGLAFMTEDHHRIRNLVVRELPRTGAPLSPQWIAAQLDLPVAKVVAILEDLEKHMTFLFRNPHGEVEWAYPVTVARTPHKITFSSGEKLYAA